MSPTIANLVVFGLQELIQNFPELVTEFQSLFSAGTPTTGDFAALRLKILTPYNAFDPKPLPVPITVLPSPAPKSVQSDLPASTGQQGTAAAPAIESPAPSLPAVHIGSLPAAAAAPASAIAPAPSAASTKSITPPTPPSATETAKPVVYGEDTKVTS